MNAEEFGAAVRDLGSRLRALDEIWRKLDRHRLELEEAEPPQPEVPRCGKCNAPMGNDIEPLCPACHEKVQGDTPAHGATAALDTISQEQHAAVIRRVWAIEQSLHGATADSFGYAISKRFGKIEQELKELSRVYVRHITKLHAVAKPVDEREYPMTPEDATESPPSSG